MGCHPAPWRTPSFFKMGTLHHQWWTGYGSQETFKKGVGQYAGNARDPGHLFREANHLHHQILNWYYESPTLSGSFPSWNWALSMMSSDEWNTMFISTAGHVDVAFFGRSPHSPQLRSNLIGCTAWHHQITKFYQILGSYKSTIIKFWDHRCPRAIA